MHIHTYIHMYLFYKEFLLTLHLQVNFKWNGLNTKDFITRASPYKYARRHLYKHTGIVFKIVQLSPSYCVSIGIVAIVIV